MKFLIALLPLIAAVPALANAADNVSFLNRGNGKVAYELSGPESKRLAILVPGVGDSRHSYRFLVPQLHAAGWRTVSLSLRGLDESSTNWEDFSPEAVGSDVVALIDTLGVDSVVVIGNSIGGPVTVWAAAERPEQVKGLVMIAPFIRETKMPWMKKVMFKLALARPWGVSAWIGAYKGSYPTNPPADFNQYVKNLKSMLKEKGRYATFQKMIWTSPAACEARIPEVKAPTLLIFGDKDKDFDDPAGEMKAVGELLGAKTLLVKGSGHYPQAEFPKITGKAIVDFIGSLK